MRLLQLPFDLISSIFNKIDNKVDLCSLARVSKVLYPYAAKRLYNCFIFKSTATQNKWLNALQSNNNYSIVKKIAAEAFMEHLELQEAYKPAFSHYDNNDGFKKNYFDVLSNAIKLGHFINLESIDLISIPTPITIDKVLIIMSNTDCLNCFTVDEIIFNKNVALDLAACESFKRLHTFKVNNFTGNAIQFFLNIQFDNILSIGFPLVPPIASHFSTSFLKLKSLSISHPSRTNSSNMQSYKTALKLLITNIPKLQSLEINASDFTFCDDLLEIFALGNFKLEELKLNSCQLFQWLGLWQSTRPGDRVFSTAIEKIIKRYKDSLKRLEVVSFGFDDDPFYCNEENLERVVNFGLLNLERLTFDSNLGGEGLTVEFFEFFLQKLPCLKFIHNDRFSNEVLKFLEEKGICCANMI